MTKTKKQACVLILSAAFLWGLTGLFTTALAKRGITTVTVVAMRAMGAFLFLAVYFAIRDRRVFHVRLADCKYFIGTGLCSFALFSWCYFQCIQTCSLSVAVVLLYTAPAFVVLLSFLLWKTPITKRKLMALGLTLAGCVLITGIWRQDTKISLLGIGCGLASGFCYGLYSIFSRYALEHCSSNTITVYTFLFASLGLCSLCDWSQVRRCLTDFSLLMPTLCLIICCTVAPYLLYTRGLREVESGNASILATLEPVVATLVGIFWLGDTFTFGSGIGAACILLSLFILR